MNNKIRHISAWALAVVAALLFISAGYPKILPNEAMITRFENWEYSSWFASVIGIIELTGGVAILLPRMAFYSAILLSLEMIGAIYTHLSTGIGGPLFAFIALALVASVAWLRYDMRYK